MEEIFIQQPQLEEIIPNKTKKEWVAMEGCPDLTKRYWLFYWEMYEHGGGLSDVGETFDSAEAAEAYYKNQDIDIGLVGYIFDSVEKKKIDMD